LYRQVNFQRFHCFKLSMGPNAELKLASGPGSEETLKGTARCPTALALLPRKNAVQVHACIVVR
jgi:hypothetical protein